MGNNSTTKKGNNQQNGSNGETPKTSNMDIPQDRESVNITTTTGQTTQRTTPRTPEEQAELDDLILNIYDAETESNALWREQDDYRRRIDNLEQTLKTADLNETQRHNVQAELNLNRSFYTEARDRYEKANQKYEEMNQRIYELETGNTDKAPVTKWITPPEEL